MITPERWLIILQLVMTTYMTGVIWFVQLVHYPMIARFDHQNNQQNQLEHQRRTTYVVIAPMILSLLLSMGLLIGRPAGLSWPLVTLNVLLTFAWAASTAFWQVPLHTQLTEAGFDPAVHQELVRGNWLRTAAWSLQLVVNVVMLYEVFSSDAISG